MEEPQIENVSSPEQELSLLRSKISEAFRAEGLSPKVYEIIEDWKEKRKIKADSYKGPEESVRDRLEYNIELAEIYAEIGDNVNLEGCIEDLTDIWENTKESFPEKERASFRDRLNQL